MYSHNIHLPENFVFSYRENLYFSENSPCGTRDSELSENFNFVHEYIKFSEN